MDLAFAVAGLNSPPGLRAKQATSSTRASPASLPVSSRARGHWAPVAALGGLFALKAAKPSQSRGSTRVRLAAVPAEKPTKTTLFTKAGPDGSSLGDCPFSHSVQMALKLKGVDYDVVPCTADNKPAWLVSEVEGKMPCLVHGGVAKVESAEILKWIDQEFPGPSLAVPEEFHEVFSKCGLLEAIAAYNKNTNEEADSSLLVNVQVAISQLRLHMFDLPIGTPYMCGDQLTLLDCQVLPVLYILQTVTADLKREAALEPWNLSELPESDEIRDYYTRASALPAFTQSCYSPEVGKWGWKQAQNA